MSIRRIGEQEDLFGSPPPRRPGLIQRLLHQDPPPSASGSEPVSVPVEAPAQTFKPAATRLTRQDAPDLHEIYDKALARLLWLEEFVQKTATALAKARLELEAVSNVVSQTKGALAPDAPTPFMEDGPKERPAPESGAAQS